MRTKIGIDFDNTIASYDGVFKYISAKFLRNIKINKFNKENFKKEILRFGGLSKWKKIQSLVYGKYINLAKIFPGFLEFLVLSKFRKNEIYIVSHKTKYGYFGGRRFLLRNKSLNWIKSKLIFKGNEFLKKENIFFESKKRDKIRKIDNLKCGYFIDDLKNIFFHNNFPRNTKKILFSQNTKNKIKNLKSLNSWREIGFFFINLGQPKK